MKTCTCPHEATRDGFLRTGYNSLCPFHGVPLPPVDRPKPSPPNCPACGSTSNTGGLCPACAMACF